MSDLLQVAWASLVAGAGITALFSLLVHGAIRSAESSRSGRRGASLAFGALAALAGVAAAGLVGAGVAVLATT